MKHFLYVVFIGLAFLLPSCGNSSKRSSEYYPINNEPLLETNDEDGRGGYDDDNSDTPDIGSIRLTGNIETCNKCMGYGSVQDGLYGQPQICKFCWVSTNMRIHQGWTGFNGRFGEVDAVFNTLPADYFDELDMSGASGMQNDGGGQSSDQIEAEIAWHENNIAQLEHQLEYIEGTINRNQVEQQIIQETHEIRRLRQILNGM